MVLCHDVLEYKCFAHSIAVQNSRDRFNQGDLHGNWEGEGEGWKILVSLFFDMFNEGGNVALFAAMNDVHVHYKDVYIESYSNSKSFHVGGCFIHD